MSKKDKYFFTFVGCYMISNIVTYLTLGEGGLFISNGVFIGIGTLGCIFKKKMFDN